MKVNMDTAYMIIKRSPFLVLHFGLIGLIWAGASRIALLAFLGSTLIRMFGLTAGFHRYFSHRSFKTSRWFQLVLAALGTCAAQHGPLWWASHHRHHHRYSDSAYDIHSPLHPSFLHSHIGWLFERKYYSTNTSLVPDLLRFRELVWIDNNHRLFPIMYGLLLWGLGAVLEQNVQGVSAFQIFMWGFVVSTVVLYHITFSINSFSHLFGTRPYKTGDGSRNNWIFALLTMGEGWHNNHHRYPKSSRQGFVWWQIDLTYWVLRMLAMMGVIWSLNRPPKMVIEEAYS
ncbi:acyl-CoA desaturase [bacterium]|nr:acyl-CoA desaturase [bacterium]